MNQYLTEKKILMVLKNMIICSAYLIRSKRTVIKYCTEMPLFPYKVKGVEKQALL